MFGDDMNSVTICFYYCILYYAKSFWVKETIILCLRQNEMTVLIYNFNFVIYQSPDICKAIYGLSILLQYHTGLINKLI